MATHSITNAIASRGTRSANGHVAHVANHKCKRREGGKEGEMDGGREGGREGRRDGWEGGRDGGPMNIEREGGMEGHVAGRAWHYTLLCIVPDCGD